MSTNSIWQSVDPLILLGLCGGRFASNPPLAIIFKVSEVLHENSTSDILFMF